MVMFDPASSCLLAVLPTPLLAFECPPDILMNHLRPPFSGANAARQAELVLTMQIAGIIKETIKL